MLSNKHPDGEIVSIMNRCENLATSKSLATFKLLSAYARIIKDVLLVIKLS